jgi:hypothetical protein
VSVLSGLRKCRTFVLQMPCAVFVWEVVLRDGLVWSDVPKSMWDFKENFIVSRGSWGVGLVWFLFGVISWTLWLN